MKEVEGGGEEVEGDVFCEVIRKIVVPSTATDLFTSLAYRLHLQHDHSALDVIALYMYILTLFYNTIIHFTFSLQ